MSKQPTTDGMWQLQLQNKFSLLSSTEASPSMQSKSRSDPEQPKSNQGSVVVKDNESDKSKPLRVANLNIVNNAVISETVKKKNETEQNKTNK